MSIAKLWLQLSGIIFYEAATWYRPPLRRRVEPEEKTQTTRKQCFSADSRKEEPEDKKQRVADELKEEPEDKKQCVADEPKFVKAKKQKDEAESGGVVFWWSEGFTSVCAEVASDSWMCRAEN